MKTKMLRRIISVVCAVGMSASCATGFVGAIEPTYRKQYEKMQAKIAKIDEEIKKEKEKKEQEIKDRKKAHMDSVRKNHKEVKDFVSKLRKKGDAFDDKCEAIRKDVIKRLKEKRNNDSIAMGMIKNKFEQEKKEAKEKVAKKVLKIKEKLARQEEEKIMKKQLDLSSRQAILLVENERKAQKDKAKKAAALKSIEDSKKKTKEEINNGVAGFKRILEQREYDKKENADRQARADKYNKEVRNYLAEQRKKREEKKEAKEKVAKKVLKIKEKLARQEEEKALDKQFDLKNRQLLLEFDKMRKAKKDKAKKAAALKSIEDSKKKAKEGINNGVAGFKRILEQREYDKKKKADRQARADKYNKEVRNYLAEQRKKREEKKSREKREKKRKAEKKERRKESSYRRTR